MTSRDSKKSNKPQKNQEKPAKNSQGPRGISKEESLTRLSAIIANPDTPEHIKKSTRIIMNRILGI